MLDDVTTAAGIATSGNPLLPRRILLAVDGSSLADQLVPFAASLGGPFDSEVTVLRVVAGQEVHGQVDVFEFELQRSAAHSHLDEVVTALRDRDIQAEALLVEGRPAEQIVAVAEERQFDLLMLGSHGEGGLRGWSLGSTAQKLLHCACSSLFVVPASFGPLQQVFRRILVPLDGSKRSECVLPLVEALAVHHGAEVILFHAVVEPELPRRALPCREDQQMARRLTDRNRQEAEVWLGETAQRLQSGRVDVHTRIDINANAFHATAMASEEGEVDLVVLCAHGASGDPAERHGSLSERFLRRSRVPTLVVQDMPQVRAVSRTPTGAGRSDPATGPDPMSALHFAI